MIKKMIKKEFFVPWPIFLGHSLTKMLFMQQSANMVNISFTDWQKLTTMKMETTFEHDENKW